MTIITTEDDDVLGGEPRIEGTRIGVRHVVGMVREGGMDPATVADELGIEDSTVERCLEYYDTHREDMAVWERREEQLLSDVAAESRAPEV